jgi:hypothetical protein
MKPAREGAKASCGTRGLLLIKIGFGLTSKIKLD